MDEVLPGQEEENKDCQVMGSTLQSKFAIGLFKHPRTRPRHSPRSYLMSHDLAKNLAAAQIFHRLERVHQF